MQKIGLYTITLLFINQVSFAQKINSDVVVWGSGPGAIAAGIQSARSGVKTLLITENEISEAVRSGSLASINNPAALQNGIWAEFAGAYYKLKDLKDIGSGKIRLEPETAAAILRSICDTVKNLTMLQNGILKEIRRAGKAWDIRLAGGSKIKAGILVDGTKNQLILNKLQLKLTDTINIAFKAQKASDTYLRTSIAAIDSSVLLPILNILPGETENMLAIPAFNSMRSDMQAGQAAGAAAAYAAFFKTTTKNLNIRLIQSELLTYKSALIPFWDVLPADINFVKIQHIAVTGLLNAGIQEKEGKLYFMPDNTLSAAELRIPMKNLFSRSQIWFSDHASEKLTIDETINLLMYTATKGEELKKDIEKGWKSRFGFRSEYDPKQAISRYEFAVLADTYLQPFGINIDFQGHLLN